MAIMWKEFTIKAPRKFAADDILIFFIFQKKKKKK